MLLLLFCFLLLGGAQTCHPECHYTCDDPVCLAVCQPVCQPADCDYLCTNPVGPCPGHVPSCSISCPTDQCETGSCPVCEVTCSTNIPQVCQVMGCAPVCQAVNCTWQCRKPTNCALPSCELQCEAPACEYSTGSKIGVSLAMIFLALFILF